MSEQEQDKISMKVRAWLQAATNKIGVDPYLTAEMMNIADKRAEEIWAIGLAENAKLSSERQDIRTNPILLLISVFKPTVIQDRLREVGTEEMGETLAKLRTIFCEEAESVSSVRRQEFDSLLDQLFPVEDNTVRRVGS